jgi:hypothetical protein
VGARGEKYASQTIYAMSINDFIGKFIVKRPLGFINKVPSGFLKIFEFEQDLMRKFLRFLRLCKICEFDSTMLLLLSQFSC